MLDKSIQWILNVLVALTLVVFLGWAGILFLGDRRPAFPPVPAPPVQPAGTVATSQDAEALAKYYTEVAAAQRANASFQRDFIANQLHSVLELLLKALIAATAVRTAPLAIAAIRKDSAATIDALKR